MYKFLSVFIMFICGLTLSAQQKLSFSVLEFEQDMFDTSAKSAEYGKKDGNGSWYAIIKVTSNNPDDDITACQFNFGNMSSRVEKHNDALWIYVQRNAKTVTITRPGYYTIEKYDLQTTIEAGANYKMVLKGAVTHQKLHIKCTPSDAVVLIDGEVIEENPITLPLGTHKYTVAAKGFISQSGSVELNENGPGKLIIELDRKEQSQLMPQPSSENEGTTNITLTPEEVELQNTFNEIFDAISDWLDIKPGRTNLQELSGKYNVRINHNEGFNSCELKNEETTITCFDYDKDGVVDYVDLTLFKEGLSEIHLMQQDKRFPDFFDGISFNSNYNEWNQWFVSKGLRYQKYNRENPALIFTFRINKKLKNINIVFRPLKSPDKTTLSGIGIGMSE